jgi:CheY-like chemotaxis protein
MDNPEGRNKTLLIVDDTPENITLLSGLLKSHYRIKAATSGEKALTIAAREPVPDLVLLDVMMPEMDGYEVCKRLRGDSLTMHIPVIFVSGHNTPQERERGSAAGAQAFITKPVSPDQLLQVITQLLAPSGAGESSER